MLRRLIILIFGFLFFLANLNNVLAIENPTSADNNKFGIHILNESDLDDTALLVNSSGGDWGYFTIVIREDERDKDRWQKVFDRARRLHLIPIVRIASKQEGENWVKPKIEDVDSWVTFFDSLNWVIKNRYVIVGNEVNHAFEWGGEVKPLEYAEYLTAFSASLKISSKDYFIMTAGLDASAPNDKTHMSEEKYLSTIIKKYPRFFDSVDGWTSHSYPNPNFTAPPTNTGQKSVKTYEWELSMLKKYGINKTLPVFITETGWAYNISDGDKYLDVKLLDDYYIKLFDIYSSDSRVVVFTPFLLSYTEPPFNIFSWKKSDGTFHSFYEKTQKYLKLKGSPVQYTEAEIVFELVPEFIKKNNKIFAAGIAKNTGQSIWTLNSSITGVEKGEINKIEIDSPVFTDIEPGKVGIILYRRL